MLIIMADEHSPHVVGAYGNTFVQTPNIDALAASGTRFAKAYCPFPICVPSRASFATGRFAHEIGSWDNAAPYVGTEAPSWGHRLLEQGHAVTTVGKLHYRKTGDPSGFPDQRIPMHVLDGVGDSLGLLRGESPPVRTHRRAIENAGAGDTEYTRYDRGIAQQSARWLKEEAPKHNAPWALFVSLVTPHFPYVAPPEHYAKYDPDALPMPVAWQQQDWADHPALNINRRLHAHDEPFSEATIRKGIAAYYGLVSFMDEQVGIVMDALADAGLADSTRVIYTSDHGDALGEHGFWMKGTMYEAVAGIPMIVSGPDVPRGHVSNSFVSLYDVFPSVVECVGASFTEQDASLPGSSMWEHARVDTPRTIFAEYHASSSPAGFYMIRDGKYKFTYYVGYDAQLFDLESDPDELRDLSKDAAHAKTLAMLEGKLRAICDPEEIDRRAKADQARRIEERGGREEILRAGVRIPYSPAPAEFGPAPEPGLAGLAR